MINKQHIEKVIRQIEHNLNDVIDISKISNMSYTSSSQLYRDFYNITGHSVKEYIRKRRISKALTLIKHSNLSLSVIANTCGYSTQQALCKVLKSMIGQTPLEYKQSDNYYYFPEFNKEYNQQIIVSTETIPTTTKLIYYSSQLKDIENNAVIQFLDLIPDYSKRIFGRSSKQFNKQFYYEIYVEITEDQKQLLSQDFVICELTPSIATLYAKTTVVNIDEAISSAWNYLYMDWLNTSMFEQSGIEYFEEYKHRCGKINRLVLYLPIHKRVGYNKITIQSVDDMMFLVSRSSCKNSEEEASQRVIDFINSNHTYVLKDTEEYFRTRIGKEHICGIRLKYKLNILQTDNIDNIEIFRTSGFFAVLECGCYGKSTIFENLLISWINDNGFEKEDIIFTTYNIKNGFDDKNIQTKIYIKLKMGILDNKSYYFNDKIGT